MALHEANQARSSHYPQWHCGPKLHLLATNDILHLLGKHSTTWPQRAHHHLSGQRSVVLPRYRLVPCKQLSRLRNNQRRVHIWSNPNQYSCAHTRYLSSPAAATLQKHKVSCSGFLPKPEPMQHSCSQSNAICNHSFKKRIELRTREPPLLQNT